MKIIIKLLIVFFTPISIYAHSLLLNLIDNEDGTITIVGEFSTGDSASGAMIQFKNINTKEIFFEKRLNDESEITIEIPKTPYEVILDGGPGHKVIKKGIAPIGGFLEENKKVKKTKIKEELVNNSSNNTIKFLLIMVLIILICTIAISVYNTNKLINQLKKS